VFKRLPDYVVIAVRLRRKGFAFTS